MNRDERLNDLQQRLNLSRRNFLKGTAAGAGAIAASGLIEMKYGKEAKAFAYEPYPRDDQLETVVTSCAHNCGSRHMLVAHKWKDVIVRLSTDDGRYQRGGYFGKDGNEEPQLRACLRGRSYRQRLYSAERLLFPMIRVGERGEGKFKRVSWDEALNFVAQKMVYLKNTYGPTALLDQSTSRTRSKACWAVSWACSVAAPAPGPYLPTRVPPPAHAGPSAPSRMATRTTPSPNPSS